MREAYPPQTTCSPGRPLAAQQLIRHARVALRERRGGPPLLKLGPHRDPGLRARGPPQPRLATWRPALRCGTHRGCERRAVRPDAGRDTPPPGHEPLARQRDQPAPAQAATAVAQARLRPRRQRPRGLPAEPAPGQRPGHGAAGVMAGCGEATRLDGVPTGSGRGGQAAERSHCLAMPEGPPAEACPHKAPGTSAPHPLPGAAWPHVFPRRSRGRRPQRAACGGHRAKALRQPRDLLPRLAAPVSESRRERRAIPAAAGRHRWAAARGLAPRAAPCGG